MIDEDTRSHHSETIQKELKIPEDDIFFISAATGEGTQKLLNSLTEEITNIKSDLA